MKLIFPLHRAAAASALALCTMVVPQGRLDASQVIPAQRLTDIATGIASSNPNHFILIDERLFFTASDKKGHRGVYEKSLVQKDLVTFTSLDWTAKGNTPKLLKAFKLPLGATDMDEFAATESNGLPLTGKVYFHVPGAGLWMTTGKTPVQLGKFDSGTNQVTSLTAVQADSGAINPLVYFGGWNKKTGEELWSSQGTVKKTTLVKDIVPGTGSSSPDEIVELKQGDASAVFFRATGSPIFNQVQPAGIWSTLTGNIAEAAPVLSSTTSSPDNLITSEELHGLYFTMQPSPGAVPELWSTDVTGANTVQLTSSGVNPTNLCTSQQSGDLVFSGSDSFNGTQIWTAASTEPPQVLDVINPAGNADPHDIVNAYFSYFCAATAQDTQSQNHVYLVGFSGLQNDFGFVDSVVSGTAFLITNPTSITSVTDSTGNGTWVYFVGDGYVSNGLGGATFKQGILWKVVNDGSSFDATPVLDKNNAVVTGATNLTPIINTGLGLWGLFFSRDGGDGAGAEVWLTAD